MPVDLPRRILCLCLQNWGELPQRFHATPWWLSLSLSLSLIFLGQPRRAPSRPDDALELSLAEAATSCQCWTAFALCRWCLLSLESAAALTSATFSSTLSSWRLTRPHCGVVTFPKVFRLEREGRAKIRSTFILEVVRRSNVEFHAPSFSSRSKQLVSKQVYGNDLDAFLAGTLTLS